MGCIWDAESSCNNDAFRISSGHGSAKGGSEELDSGNTAGLLYAYERELMKHCWWILERRLILKLCYSRTQTTTGLLPNYLGEDTFSEAAATALMVSVSYRLGQLGLDSSTIRNAHAARKAVFGAVDQSTGWLTSVVNPRDWSVEGEESAEGQAFTLLLAAAYRDYVNTTNDIGDDIPIATGTSTTPVPSPTASTTGGAPQTKILSLSAMSATLLISLILLAY